MGRNRMVAGSEAGDFFGADLLGPLQELNQYGLELVRQRARDGAMGRALPPFLCELAPSWAALEDLALQRIAASPYSLLESCWIGPSAGAASRVLDAGDTGCFPPEAAGPLLRELLLLGWHTVRSTPRAAQALLGMDRGCLELLSRCSLRELQRLGQAGGVTVRLRWAERTRVWRQLLSAAVAADDRALGDLRLRGLQLIAAEGWGGPAP
jgi:hypothetical protein